VLLQGPSLIPGATSESPVFGVLTGLSAGSRYPLPSTLLVAVMYSSAARHTGRLTCPTAMRRFSKWSATWCLRGSDYLTVRIKNFAGAPLNNKLQPLRAHALFGAFAGRGVFPSFPPSPQFPGKKDSIEQKHQWSRLVENLPVEKPAKKTKKKGPQADPLEQSYAKSANQTPINHPLYLLHLTSSHLDLHLFRCEGNIHKVPKTPLKRSAFLQNVSMCPLFGKPAHHGINNAKQESRTVPA